MSDSDILRNLSEVTGTGELYTTDGAGNISFLRKYTGWRPSWTHIIPGNFGRSQWTGLLFYEQSTGTGEFYTTDGFGRLSFLRKYTGWRPSWTHIIPGNFGHSQWTDLLFYEQSTGTGEFYTTDGAGNISFLRTHTDWRSTWKDIIPGYFDRRHGWTGLLFYEQSTGTGEFWGTDGAGNISFLRTHTGWRPSWTHIIPGDFGGRREWTDLLFYEAGT